MSIQTIMAHLQVLFDSQEDKDIIEIQVDQEMKKFLRIDSLRALHHNVELRFEPTSAVG